MSKIKALRTLSIVFAAFGGILLVNGISMIFR